MFSEDDVLEKIQVEHGIEGALSARGLKDLARTWQTRVGLKMSCAEDEWSVLAWKSMTRGFKQEPGRLRLVGIKNFTLEHFVLTAAGIVGDDSKLLSWRGIQGNGVDG